jgi:cytochrome P450
MPLLPEIVKNLWQSAVAEEHKVAEDFSNLKELATARLQIWFARPEVIRALSAGLRNHMPVCVAPGLAIVTRYPDVLEVLSNDRDFTIKEINAAKMARTSGPFILGMDDSPQLQHEKAILRAACRPEDLDRIRGFDTQCANQIIDEARPKGRMDAVNELFHVVPTRLVAHYFGVPGPDEPTMMRWSRTLFHEIFLNLNNDQKVQEAADISAREMNSYLNDLIAKRKPEIAASQSTPDDFLGRLLKMQSDPVTRFDDEAGVRRNIAGLVLGAIDTTSKALAQALDQLMRYPDAFQAAKKAALDGDDAKVAAYVFEALRFNPHNPIILRHCARDYTVAKGTPRETVVPAGSLVFAATISAMFDESELDAPEEFRADRPAEHYLHFGHGLHTCFGEAFNRVQVPEVMKRLLRLKGLRRAAGTDGVMTYDGPFPNRLIVEFEAA